MPAADVLDTLPPTQQLLLETLAARLRLGHTHWTFSHRCAPAAKALVDDGLITTRSGPLPGRFEARLTTTGQTATLDPDYTPPGQAKKRNHIDAPTFLLLRHACIPLWHAFGGMPYLVGSALQRPDWRDVDVRLILDDHRYGALFPGIDRVPGLIHARWSVLCASISLLLRQQTGLPVDFQFQSSSDANARYPGPREPLAVFPDFTPPEEDPGV